MRLIVSLFVLFTVGFAQVRRAGDLKIFPHCAVDLDAGECACVVTVDGDGTEPPGHPSGKNDDFRLEPSGSRLYVQPRHRTLLAKPTPSPSELTGCTAAQYANARIRVDGLSKGSSICVRTNEGRYAEITVDQTIVSRADHISLSYRTWEKWAAYSQR